VTILSGPGYPEGDVLLFNELLALMEGSGIAGVEAEQLAMTADDARSTFDEQEALRVVAFRVPAFRPLAPLLIASSRRPRQALSMLDTILRALAKKRNSGIIGGPRRTLGSASAEASAGWKDLGPLSRTWRDTRRG
jgi:hypothetical protein